MQLDRVQLPFSNSASDLLPIVPPHALVSRARVDLEEISKCCYGLDAERQSRVVLKEDLHIRARFDLIEAPGRYHLFEETLTERYLNS